MKQWIALATCCLLAACATTPPPAEPSAPEAREEKKPMLESQPLRNLKGRVLKPQPTRPLNVRSRCTHRDALGTRTRLDLRVKNAEVLAFDVQVDIREQGACRFRLAEFKQTATLPNVLLEAKDGSGCSVRMWEQGNQTTLAFQNCPAACEGAAFDYLWPILVQTKSGRCY